MDIKRDQQEGWTYLFLFYKYECLSNVMYMHYVHAVPLEVRRGHWFP